MPVSDNTNRIDFTAICSYGEQKQILQLTASNPREALDKWVLLMQTHRRCILSSATLTQLAKDYSEGIIEPVEINNVISVWNCSDVINSELIDLILVAMVPLETKYNLSG
jgi:hypothetical protein